MNKTIAIKISLNERSLIIAGLRRQLEAYRDDAKLSSNLPKLAEVSKEWEKITRELIDKIYSY